MIIMFSKVTSLRMFTTFRRISSRPTMHPIALEWRKKVWIGGIAQLSFRKENVVRILWKKISLTEAELIILWSGWLYNWEQTMEKADLIFYFPKRWKILRTYQDSFPFQRVGQPSNLLSYVKLLFLVLWAGRGICVCVCVSETGTGSGFVIAITGVFLSKKVCKLLKLYVVCYVFNQLTVNILVIPHIHSLFEFRSFFLLVWPVLFVCEGPG